MHLFLLPRRRSFLEQGEKVRHFDGKDTNFFETTKRNAVFSYYNKATP
jgi:hypothetical protein